MSLLVAGHSCDRVSVRVMCRRYIHIIHYMSMQPDGMHQKAPRRERGIQLLRQPAYATSASREPSTLTNLTFSLFVCWLAAAAVQTPRPLLSSHALLVSLMLAALGLPGPAALPAPCPCRTRHQHTPLLLEHIRLSPAAASACLQLLLCPAHQTPTATVHSHKRAAVSKGQR